MRLNLSFALVCMVRESRYSSNGTNNTTTTDISNGSESAGVSFRDDIISSIVSTVDPLVSLSVEQKNALDDVDDLYQVRAVTQTIKN